MSTETTSVIYLPCPTERFLSVIEMMQSRGIEQDPVSFIMDRLLDYAIENMMMKEDLFVPEADTFGIAMGFRWGGVFLPSGTVLWFKYKGGNYYAKVEGDKLIYRGEPVPPQGAPRLRPGQEVTPSEFANLVSGTMRNAWVTLYVRRPGDAEWRLADHLRA